MLKTDSSKSKPAPQGNALTIEHDNDLRITTVRDALNQATTIAYDSQSSNPNLIRSITDPFGRTATFDYTAEGQLWKITDPEGIVSEMSYTTGDFVNAFTTPYGTWTIEWGTVPSQFSHVDSLFVQVTDPYGDRERVEQFDASLGQYDPGSTEPMPPSSIDVDGTPVSFNPQDDNLNWRNSYYWDKQQMRYHAGDYSRATVYNWLAINNQITGVAGSIKRPDESRVWFNYPGQSSKHAPGNFASPSKVVRAVEDETGALAWQMTQNSYDPNFGNLTETTDPMGRRMAFEYNPGNVVPGAIPGIDLTAVKVDNNGTWETLATYSDFVNGLPTMTYRYFIDGSLAAVEHSDPNTPDVSYAYNDPLARLTAHNDQLGTTTYSYIPFTGSQNGAGELYQVNGPWADDTLRYAYDWQGRRQSRTVLDDAENPLHSVAYTFDTLGRVTSETNNLGTFTYQYAPGNHTAKVNAVQFPTASGIEVAYDYYPTVGNANDDRLKEIHTTGPGGTISKFGYEYDPNGRIRQWTQQQGGASALRNYTFAYDRNSQLTDATVKDASDNVIKNWSWQYDAAGNRLRESVDTASTYTEANELNQLLQIGGAGTTLVEGTVDKPSIVMVNEKQAAMFALPGGEFLFRRTVPVTEGSNTITVEATDASENVQTNVYTVEIGGVQKTLEYDLNGNLRFERDGSGAVLREFQWDARNRLVAIIDGDNKTEFEYDGLDRRIRVTEKEWDSGTSSFILHTSSLFIWDGLTIIEERDGITNAVVKRYFDHGFEIVSGPDAGSYFTTFDHLGSIREIVDDSGTVVTRYDYSPFGEVEKVFGTVESDFLFTGHFHHTRSGLHLAPFRAYDVELGRWLSRDPLFMAELLYEGPSLYTYGPNSPINGFDPNGALWHVAGGAVVGAIIGAVGTRSVKGAVAGAVGGAVTAATFNPALGAAASAGLTGAGGAIAAGAASGLAGGLASGLVDQTGNLVDGCSRTTFSPIEIGRSGLWGAGTGAVLGPVGRHLKSLEPQLSPMHRHMTEFNITIWSNNFYNWTGEQQRGCN